LPLADTQLFAFIEPLAEQSIVPFRQTRDHMIRAGCVRRSDDARIVRWQAHIVEPNVFARAQMVLRVILKDDANLAAQAGQRKLRDRPPGRGLPHEFDRALEAK
jgi:hypothetical protein